MSKRLISIGRVCVDGVWLSAPGLEMHSGAAAMIACEAGRMTATVGGETFELVAEVRG